MYHRLWVIGKIITLLANLNSKTQFVFERFLYGYIGGFDEIIFILKKIK